MDRFAAAKVRGFGTSVFTEMSRLAVEHGAVNLGQGFPDFPGPDFLKAAAKRAIDADQNQYAPAPGTMRLRRAIAATFAKRTGIEIDPEREVTVTSGATEAIFDSLQAFLGPGDEAIIFEPFYDSYLPAVTLAGATARVITLQPPDWSFDRDALRGAFNGRTKLILVNTPHNPTGKVFTREELQFIADLCIEHDVMALMDEVYDRILFDGAEHVCMATLPGMWERTLTLNSTGKTFSMTGWKLGYAVGPASLNAALRAVHQFVTFASGTPFQDAMAEALETAEARGYYATFAAEYDERRHAMADVLHNAGFTTLPIHGSYFLMADIAGRGFDTDAAFCRWLTSEVKVAALPPSAFYVDATTAPMLARFCFAKQLGTIAEAGRRMEAAGLRA